MLAALSAFLALFLAWHHPLAPALALLLCVGLAALVCVRPGCWPWLLLPALPLAGLGPWTGWRAVEEFDLLLLAVAAGGHARLAWDQVQAPSADPPAPVAAAGGWLLPVVALAALALWRGLQASTGGALGWWQGPGEAADSLRLAKGLLAAGLLWPLLRAGWREDPAAASTRLTRAFSAMLLVAGLAVLWERLAAGTWRDLSAETAAGTLFWGLQGGSAPLAALLAVGMPFAAAAWAQARQPRDALLPVLALALGAHACVVSFSPVAVLAVAVGLGALTILLQADAGRSAGRMARNASAGRTAAGLGAAARRWWRLAAFLAVALLLASLLARVPGSERLAQLAEHSRARQQQWQQTLARLGGAQDWLLGRGLGPGRAALLGSPDSLAGPGGPLSGDDAPALATSAAAQTAALNEARSEALKAADGIRQVRHFQSWAVELPGMTPLPGRGLPWRLTQQVAVPQPGAAEIASVQVLVRWRVLPGGVGAPGAGTGLALVAETPGGPSEPGQPAGPAPMPDASNSAGTEPRSELQPGAAAGTAAPPRSEAQPRPPRLVAELCASPAAPPWGCIGSTLALPAAAMGSGRADPSGALPTEPLSELAPSSLSAGLPDGQLLTLSLPGPRPAAGLVPMPRAWRFSLALDAPGGVLEVHRVRLLDASGQDLLRNGDFGAGLAHWYALLDPAAVVRPNTPLQLLVDQGLLGLGAWALAAGWALWRLGGGAARSRRLAAPLLAAGAGLAVVAAVHDLFNLPRASFLLALWLLLALALPGRRSHARRPDLTAPARSRPSSAGCAAGPAVGRA